MSINLNTRGLAAAAITAALTLAPTVSAFAANSGNTSNSSSSQTNLYSDVERSIVKLDIGWSGYILFESEDGWEWSEEIITFTGCTGFFVDDKGSIVTAGHCVDPEGGREALIKKFVGQLYDEGRVTDANYAAVLDYGLLNWTVEGATNGSDIERKVWAYQPDALEDPVLEDDLVAQVLDVQTIDEGDVALLKIGATNTPALSVASDDPQAGTEVTSIGFPGSVGALTSGEVRASFKTGTISSQQVLDSGISVTEINADVDFGMSGGPTIDDDGNVLGVNSFKAALATNAFNFITDTTDLGDWLDRQGVDVTLGSAGGSDDRGSDNGDAETAGTTGSGTGSGTDSGTDSGDNETAAGAASGPADGSSAKSPLSSSSDGGDPLVGILIGGGIAGGLLLTGLIALTVILAVRRSGAPKGAYAAHPGVVPAAPAPVVPTQVVPTQATAPTQPIGTPVSGGVPQPV